mmetsp:Transcript_52050/g.59453  ORF Transcript_52050/g.59453 Transcript_52050/m.59453 type:complete len:257 (-) Transcript_52050:210-980(-)
MKLLGKKLLLIGGNGYIGRSCAQLAQLYGAQVHSLSRSGTVPSRFIAPWCREVTWHKGNALDPRSYSDLMQDMDGIIFSVGTLFDSTIPFSSQNAGGPGSYEELNRNTLIAAASTANEIAKGKNFILFSASMGLPLIPRYLKTKRQAEDFLKTQSNINHTILRPGIVYNPSSPLKYAFSKLVNITDIQYRFYARLAGVLSKTASDMVRDNLCAGRAASIVDLAYISVHAALSDNLNNVVVHNDDIETVGKEIREKF